MSASTRLDRLLNLVATGATPVVRDLAAAQIGQIAAQRIQHSSAAQRTSTKGSRWHGTDGEWHEIVQLIAKLLPHLSHRSAASRTAAAQAIQAVCDAVGVWDPSHAEYSCQANEETIQIQTKSRRLVDFDLYEVISQNSPLVASAGDDYANEHPVEPEAAEKDLLTSMGLDHVNGHLNLDDDFEEARNTSKTKPQRTKNDIQAATVTSHDEFAGLSARERAALKLKRKRQNAANTSNKMPKLESSDKSSPPLASTSKRHDKVKVENEDNTSTNRVVIDHKVKANKIEVDDLQIMPAATWTPPTHIWPFLNIVRKLAEDLLVPNWITRHGAALGLNAVLKSQGFGAGKVLGSSRPDNVVSHEAWSEDIAYQLLSVFALDRFGDYQGDTVAAPVREAAGNALSALLSHCSPSIAFKVQQHLLAMAQQHRMSEFRKEGESPYIWQVRHAGLLGMRYVLEAVDPDIISDGMLNDMIQIAMLGLKDGDDDVRAASANALLPIYVKLHGLPSEQLAPLLLALWDALISIADDLASSASAILSLLSQLNTERRAFELMAIAGLDVRTLVARLYPFFRHVITDVRRAVIANIRLLLRQSDLSWVDGILLSFLVQNIIVEQKSDLVRVSGEALSDCIGAVKIRDTDFIGWLKHAVFNPSMNWMAILATPPAAPLNVELFVRISQRGEPAHDIDKAAMRQDMSLISEESLIDGRVLVLRVLARVLQDFDGDSLRIWLETCLMPNLQSRSAFRISMSAILLQFIGRDDLLKAGLPLYEACRERLIWLSDQEGCLEVDEASSVARNMHQAAENLREAVLALGTQTPSDMLSMSPSRLLQFAQEQLEPLFSQASSGSRQKNNASANKRKSLLVDAVQTYRSAVEPHEVRVLGSSASAIIACGMIPPKISFVIKGLMNSIKVESIESLQKLTSQSLADFIVLCTNPDSPVHVNPSDKVIKNLCTFLCQDTAETPIFVASRTADARIVAASEENQTNPQDTLSNDSATNKAGQIVRRGANFALAEMAKSFGSKLFETLPRLWTSAAEVLLRTYGDSPALGDQSASASNEVGQSILDSCTIIPIVASHVHAGLHEKIGSLFPALGNACSSDLSIIRSCAAKALARVCVALPTHGLAFVIDVLLKDNVKNGRLSSRRGLVELISFLVDLLDIGILPYLVFFIEPVLQGMTDAEEDIRRTSSKSFAVLVKLMPLELATENPPGMTAHLVERRNERRGFISQLLNGAKSEPYEIPVTIKAELRGYQHEGVSWLAFLAKYSLHGILCDDMGLGKTLQTICILASSAFEQKQKLPADRHLTSLVICPPTLTEHWAFEIKQYTDNLRVRILAGPASDRSQIIASLGKIDVLVLSYEVARSSIAILSPLHWNYCVLDEGHIIKNSKTRLSQALKQLRADHRLILSGTPVQNNVLELWNLFDFLMPGFLGNEKTFSERYGKPIAASRDAKSTTKQQAAGTLALEALHKQVLPFLLRRLKEDVLEDLPPKIIQDYYCELSPVQKLLYDDESAITNGEHDKAQPHVFQSLQFLRRLVNHPLLVYDKIAERLRSVASFSIKNGQPPNLHDLEHAPKLLALQQILNGCGIGVKSESQENELDGVAPHRVLIFCQLKEMLDIIEQDLFARQMPTVTYMRLDGDTPSAKRHGSVQLFNSDPSIDVLLLTTHVGGLGLTLTGADTVIFVEHDWNPMKDLQAMDRAHRLGQKRVVNVYRLIMRDTLEEKIMGLQKFKLNIASSVVNEQNSGLDTMDTDQVLDLFDGGSPTVASQSKKSVKLSRQALLDGLADIDGDTY